MTIYFNGTTYDERDKTLKIAILGWGSLIWEKCPEFDEWREDWCCDDGPAVKLEFSRISESRDGALTLVIDELNGDVCKVAYAISKRQYPDDSICDLRSREGTSLRRIGYYFADGSRSGDPDIPESIRAWTNKTKLDVVVWTALPSNFREIRKKAFSVPEALSYLKTLTPEQKVRAAEYVWRAPQFIRTPLRRELEVEPWFACQNGE